MNRNDFLKSAKQLVKTEVVTTLAGDMIVRGMSAGERDEFEQNIVAAKGKGETPKDIRAKVAVACVIDEDGKKIFTQSDIKELSELPASVLDPILTAALKLSGLDTQAIEEAKKN